ncbi:hypothetical protein BRC71_01130 [Halobacteriales archaeon QH_7_65_31]|nr:MAG: hypothetical protein BRC71_01130 [Halobacteriales archaeon QH_7_65_31]
MAEIDAGDLLPNERVMDAVADGEITQLTRGAGTRYAEEGDRFAVDGDRFTVVEIEERTLGEMTDADAEREGSPSLSAYKARMKRAHPSGFEWNDDADVLTYRFERDD